MLVAVHVCRAVRWYTLRVAAEKIPLYTHAIVPGAYGNVNHAASDLEKLGA